MTTLLQESKNYNKSVHYQLIFQIDSLILYKVIKKEWGCPWNIASQVEETQAFLSNQIHKFQHILREGNTLADFLANTTIDKGGSKFTSFKSLEPMGRKWINSDKQ